MKRIKRTICTALALVVATATILTTPAFAQKAAAPPTPAPTPAKAVTPVALPAKEALKEAAKPEAKPEAKTDTKAPTSDDASIAAAVKAKLSSMPSLKDANIDVSVSDGVATLTGMLKTGGLKGVATNAAKRVPGVKSVKNSIEIEKKK